MKKSSYAVAGLSVLIAGMVGGANAQTINNNFSRDRNISVTDRAHPEYAPLGLHAGAFTLSPTVGVGLGYNDNIKYTNTSKISDSFIELTPELRGASTWSRHALSFDLGVASDTYSSHSTENTTGWNASVDGRVDISSAANITAGVSHARSYEPRSSYQADPNAKKPVPIDYDRAHAELTLVGNRLKFVGGLSTQSESYKSVDAVSGPPLVENGRNLKTTRETGRADYAVSPSVSVFVYTEANQRRYDVSTNYDSDGMIAALGSSFELSSTVRGEVAVGSIEQNYKHLTTGKVNSSYVNAKVEWFPTDITTVTGKLERSYSDSPYNAGGNAPALYTGGEISADHELLRNLILSASLKHFTYEFIGLDRKDTGDNVGLSARYLLNRRMTLVAKFMHQKYASTGTAAFRSFNDNAATVNLVFSY